MYLWLSACGPQGPTTEAPVDAFDAAAVTLPPPGDLPLVDDPPPALAMWSEDLEIDDVATFDARRRPEILLLASHYEYGRPGAQGGVPPLPPVVIVQREAPLPVLGGAVVLERLHVEVDDGAVAFVIDWFRPPSPPGPVPVFLALEKCGLHSLVADDTVPLPTAFVHPDCEGGATDAGRGSRAGEWELAAVTAAGASVAAIHESELAPDDELGGDAPMDVLAGPPGDDDAAWGAIGQWALGLRLARRALEDVDGVDVDHLVVFGHSRRGKAALWAAAQDEGFPAVWAHQSGTGGAKLTRSLLGEPVGAVTQLFPHWFADHFDAFTGRESALPFDQHALLAAVAPRRVWLSDGEEDLWAGPDGVDQALEHAAPAFGLLGGPQPVHHLRPGGHSVEAGDWAWALGQLADWP